MIITLTRYIFLLLFISTLSEAKKIDLTFEVFHAKNKYINIAREKALALREKGFTCYIVKGKENLSVRCNDVKTSKEMQRIINRFNKKDIKFSIINRKTKADKRGYKTLNEFYLGYAAFDRKDYKKALKIFEYNYKKENNYEHAYAYALALLKRSRYVKALEVLDEYRKISKAAKLYRDIALTYMYRELNSKRYKMAHEIVNKYYFSSKKLHDIIDKQEVNDLIQAAKYEKAKSLAKKYHLKNKVFEIDYMKALYLQKVKKYDASNELLKAYLSKDKRAYNLFILNILAKTSLYYAKKDYKKALSILTPYRSSRKVQKLYNDILYTRFLNKGWKLVNKEPKLALEAFKASCNIKKEYSCYSGMMYSYFNLKKYDQSLYLADKLYAAEPNDALSTIAMRSSLRLKQYNKAQIWFDRTKNKEGLTSPSLLETFLTIDDYIKAKDYKSAYNIVNYLSSLYPKNIEILKQKMQLYILQEEYDKAYNIAKKILSFDPKSVEAKYTFSLYEFEHQEYKRCESRLLKLKLTQPYQIQLLNRCTAYADVSKRDINSAIKAIDKIDDANIKVAFYVDLGDMYKSIGNPLCIRAYHKAKSYKKDDFDLEILYLYALKEFMKDEALDKALIKAYKDYPLEHKRLDALRHAYEKDRLYSYYKNKRYSECYNYANVIEANLDDRDVYRMGAWCAYSLKKYNKAKEKFAKINLKYGEDAQDVYAYALSAFQLKERQRAIEALERIKNIDSDKERILIAQLYIDLQEQEKAKALLMKLPPSDKRNEALVKVNKSYTRVAYENAASVGMYYKSQTGASGKSRFNQFLVPVDYDYFNKEDKYHIYFNGDLMYLSNGYLSGGVNSYLNFGLATSTQDNALGSDIGFMPKIGIDYKNIRAELGSTPIGAKISPEPTWLLSGHIAYNRWTGSLKFEQKELDETMLSFVGERARDGSIEVNWGRVLKRGIELGMSYNANIDLSLKLAYYPQIFGLNVEKNSEKKATAMAVYHPKVESIAYVNVGAIVAFDEYEKNSNSFTYGHGGYFSPQQFFLGSLFAKFGDTIGKDFYYQSKIGLGFEGYIMNDSPKFPLDDGIANSGTILKGHRDGGVVYKTALQVGYKINKKFDLISGVSLERINSYSVQQVSFAFVYTFEKNRDSDFNTFRLNHRVNSIIQ